MNSKHIRLFDYQNLGYLALAIHFVILFCVLTILGQNSRKISKPKSKNPISKKSTIPTQHCFSDKQLDFKTEKLPSNYQGNDLGEISEEIIRRSNPRKDEFETTLQFQQRIESEKKKPLLGELNSNSIFAFASNDVELQYDADKQLMNARLKFGHTPTLFWHSPCNKLQASRIIPILGAIYYRKPVLTSMNFNIETAKAKLTKQNLKILFIGNLYMLPSNEDYKFFLNDNIKLSLQEVWIYDVVTGEIFLKQKIDLEKTLKNATNI